MVRTNIEAERGRLQMTKTDMCNFLGITLKTYNGYIRGAMIPSTVLEQLRNVTGKGHHLVGVGDGLGNLLEVAEGAQLGAEGVGGGQVGLDSGGVLVLSHSNFPFCPAIFSTGGAVPVDGPGARSGLHFGEVLQCGLSGRSEPRLLDHAGDRDERPGFGGVVGIFKDALLEKITDGSDDTEADLFIVAPHFTEAALIIAFFHEFHRISFLPCHRRAG